jgi:hypothetical protein
MAGDFPGTQPSFVRLADDVDPYQASQINAAYDEIEPIASHFGAGTPICAGGGIRLTIVDGATTIGYVGQKGAHLTDGAAKTMLPGGAYDVTAIAFVDWVVKASDGQVSWGMDGLEPGGSALVFEDDAGNEVTLAISAGGEVTAQRTGGGLTYHVLVNFRGWI